MAKISYRNVSSLVDLPLNKAAPSLLFTKSNLALVVVLVVESKGL